LLAKRFSNDSVSVMPLNDIQQTAKARLLENLSSNIYRYESVSCLCGTNDNELIAAKDRYGIPLDTSICKSCGQVFSSTRLDAPSTRRFYDELYRPLYVGKNIADESFFNKQSRRGSRILSYLSDVGISAPARVLEIGCGAGGILYPFKESGFIVEGIDLGDSYLSEGQKHGLNLKCMSSQQLSEETSSTYDIIILSHVLEHFSDIQFELNTIDKLLSPDGVIYIEVPGLFNLKNSYECDFLTYLQNAHNYHFNLQMLTNLMSGRGYNLVIGDQCVRAVFKRCHDSTSLSEFSNQYKDVSTFLSELENNKGRYLQQLLSARNKQKTHIIEKLIASLMEYNESTVSLYGTGKHTEQLVAALPPSARAKIKNIISPDVSDDKTVRYGLPVTTLTSPYSAAIVISSDTFQESIYRRIKHLKQENVKLITLYE
jgi:SAM-dependent methyltransferase